MKQLTAILLTLSLRLTMLCAPALTEDQTSLLLWGTACLSRMDKSSEEWLETENSRAALVSFAALEILSCCGQGSTLFGLVSESIEQGEVFVCLDTHQELIILCFGEEQCAYLSYAPRGIVSAPW